MLQSTRANRLHPRQRAPNAGAYIFIVNRVFEFTQALRLGIISRHDPLQANVVGKEPRQPPDRVDGYAGGGHPR